MPLVLTLLVLIFGSVQPGLAQPAPNAGTVPNYWDPGHRFQKPDMSQIREIRFLTEIEDPPFSFVGASGDATGFLIDLARAVCRELSVRCTIQPLRWDILLNGIDSGYGDVIVSTMSVDRAAPERYAFTNRFLARPARFVARRDTPVEGEDTPEAYAGRKVGVVGGTAHEAFLKDFFPDLDLAAFKTPEAARDALKEKEVDLLFGDGINLSLWLNGTASAACCRFVGGPYTEARYFGEGLALAVAPDSRTLLQALDFALARVHRSGEYAEIYRRYFPVSFY